MLLLSGMVDEIHTQTVLVCRAVYLWFTVGGAGLGSSNSAITTLGFGSMVWM